jgi:hypothetical protein
LAYGERLEENLPSYGPLKQAGVSIILSNKVNFKLKLVKRDKEGHFILAKGNDNYQLLCTQYSTPNFIKHTLKDLKTHIDPNTVVVGDFNTHLSTADK